MNDEKQQELIGRIDTLIKKIDEAKEPETPEPETPEPETPEPDREANKKAIEKFAKRFLKRKKQ